MNYSSTHPAQRQIKKEEENVSNYKNPIRSSPVGRKIKIFSPHSAFILFFDGLRSRILKGDGRNWWNWVNWLRIFQFLGLPLMWYQSVIRTQSAVISYRFFFLVFTTPADCSFVSILFSRLKKKTHKKICIQDFFFTIHALPLLCVPATQPASVAWAGCFSLFLSLFILSFHSPRWLLISRKEGDGRI